MFSLLLAAGQNRTITGKVTDEKGTPLVNASVVVKGTNLGTTTAADGSFSLSVSPNASILVASYVGLGDKEHAFECLEKGLDDRPSNTPYLGIEPRLEPLRADPRYKELMRRLGL